MTSDQGFKLHPEAARDITDIWEYIAEENPRAVGRVREDILNGNCVGPENLNIYRIIT
jgi:plasmid stabilization system protein ParE